MAITTINAGHVLGTPAGFGTPTASVDNNVGTPSVTVTASGADTAKVFDFEFKNLKGVKGDTGDAAGFGTPTASIDNNVGTPSVVVSASGEDTEKVFNFEFSNLKGARGDTGYHIGSVEMKSGTHASGTNDVYSVKLNDTNATEIGTFIVHNGTDGLGSGDMTKSSYDTDGDGKVNYAEVADSVAWSGIQNKPIGVANGIAELDANGKVPSTQLPSYVDDVIEGYFDNGTFYEEGAHTKPITGESGKIYIDLSTNATYRWGGTTYATIGSSLALGETSSTAYCGDKGKTAYDHSQTDSIHCTSEYSANEIEQIWNTVFVGGGE